MENPFFWRLHAHLTTEARGNVASLTGDQATRTSYFGSRTKTFERSSWQAELWTNADDRRPVASCGTDAGLSLDARARPQTDLSVRP